MDSTTYRIIHIIGVAAVALAIGGMTAGGNNRRTFAIWQGIGLLVILVSGFGLLAKLKLGFPHFAIVKVVLWLLIGMLPMLFRRLNLSASMAVVISLALIGAAAWLGMTLPQW